VLTSDVRWKTNVAILTGGLDAVLALRPVRYDWSEDSPAAKARSPGAPPLPKQLGFLAQAVRDALPRDGEGVVVEVDGEGHLGLAYDKLTAVLVHAVQEEHAARRAADDGLEKENEELRKENERQQTQIDELRKQSEEVLLRENDSNEELRMEVEIMKEMTKRQQRENEGLRQEINKQAVKQGLALQQHEMLMGHIEELRLLMLGGHSSAEDKLVQTNASGRS
jgi:hypothetical protein